MANHSIVATATQGSSTTPWAGAINTESFWMVRGEFDGATAIVEIAPVDTNDVESGPASGNHASLARITDTSNDQTVAVRMGSGRYKIRLRVTGAGASTSIELVRFISPLKP